MARRDICARGRHDRRNCRRQQGVEWQLPVPAEAPHTLRVSLQAALEQRLGWEVVPGVANFLLCHLPQGGPGAAAVIEAARRHGLFLRNAAGMGTGMGERALRIAVKDEATNRRMIRILEEVA